MRRRHLPARAGHRGPGVPPALVVAAVRGRARSRSGRLLPRGPRGRRGRGLRRPADDRRRRPRRHHRGRPGLAAPPDRPARCSSSWSAAGVGARCQPAHAGGAGDQPRRPGAVPAASASHRPGPARRTTPTTARTPSSCGPTTSRTDEYEARLRASAELDPPVARQGFAAAEPLPAPGVAARRCRADHRGPMTTTVPSTSASRSTPARRSSGIETSCDETAAAVVDGRPHRALVGRVEPGRPPRPLRRRRARDREPRPRRAAHAGDRRGAGRGGRRRLAELDAVAAARRPGPRRRAARRRERRQGAARSRWDVPFVGVNHLEGHLYAALARGARRSSRRSWCCSCRAATRCSSSMEGHGRYRVLGQTVDDAAGEAFDKVGPLPRPRLPGRPGDRPARREGDPAAVALPAGRCRRGLDFSLLRAEDRGRQPRPQAPGRGRSPTSPRRSRTRSSTCSSPSSLAAADAGRRARASCSAAAWRPTRRSARAWPTACGDAPACRAFLPAAALCTDNAAMIAAAAWWRLRADGPTPLDDGVDPNLRLV